MPRRLKFTLSPAPEVLSHLGAIDRKYHAPLKRTMEEQLSYTPDVETRNRKPLRQPGPFEATWELRLGPNNRFRVFYDVDLNNWTVWILAIGVKERNRLFIGGEEFQL